MGTKSTRFPATAFFIFAAALVLLGATTAGAQSTTNGAIGGSVRDPQGLSVPKATIKLHNAGTNQDSTATTDDAGEFRAVSLEPGTYSVTAEAPGFAPTRMENVTVEVGRVTPVEIRLAVGSAASATVNVSSELPLVNTSQQDFATNVSLTSISELPINGRRWSTFALLTPGVVPDGNFGLLSFRGVSGLLNNNTVDGGDNNQAFFSEERGRTRVGYSIGQGTIREFQVNTSNFSSEYGRAAGGVVNAVTKSGTNDFHGEVFYFIRDNSAGATNPFTAISTLVNGTPTTVKIKPEDRRHQFGGVFGGPIIKDKLFFLLAYDGQRRNFPGVAATQSPTALNPITVSAPASCTPPTGTTLTPGQTLFCRGVTQAQTDSGLTLLRGLTGVVPRNGDQDIYFPKLDWHITPNHHFSATYNRLFWTSPAGIQTQAVVFRGIRSFGDDFVHADSVITHLYSTFGTKITNEIRFQFGRDNEFENTQAPAPGEPTTGPGGSVPDVLIGNVIEFGKPTFLNRKKFPDERRLQWADTMSLSAGKHLFRFGFDVNRVRDIEDNLRFEGGAFSYNNLTDFITDLSITNGCRVKRGSATNVAAPCFSQYNQAFGPTKFSFKTYDTAVFFQDDWRVLPRFTLNLGVRYEYEGLPGPQIPAQGFANSFKFPNDINNIGPRFGFALDVFGDGKTALRGGYGIYYGRVINSTIANAITNTGGPGSQVQFTIRPTDTTFTGPNFPNTLASAGTTPAKTSVVGFAPNYQNPLIQEVEVALERQVGWSTAVSVSYLLSRGQSLPTFIDRNLKPPTSTITYTVNGGPLNGQQITLPLFSGSRLNTSFNAITDIASAIRSNYNALVVAANRQLRHGLMFNANYTWSHSIDDGQGSVTFTDNNDVFNPFDSLKAEKGNSNFDIRQRFVVSAVWSPEVSKDASRALRALANGFTIAPIVTVSTGTPYTASVSGNAPGTTQGGGIIGSGGPQRSPFFARNAFHMPGLRNVDLRISRRLGIREGMSVEILAEAFNLFNRQQINGVFTRQFTVSGTNLNFDPTFGVANSAANSIYRERQMQFGARFHF